MAVPSPLMPNRPVRDDMLSPRSSPMASTGYAPRNMSAMSGMGGMIDRDADTMARESSPALMEPLEGGEPEETTRAVSRDELMRHQDAHVIVGEDAIGDEATLAIAPGQIDLGIDGGIAAALQETLQKRESQPQFPVPPPPFGNNMQQPMGGQMGGHPGQMGSSGHLPAAQPYGQGPHGGGGMGMQQQPQSWGAGEAAQSYRNPPQMGMGMPAGGFDPMLPQGPQSNPGMPGQYPQSGQQPVMQGHGGFAPEWGQGYGPNANAPTAQQQRPMGAPMHGQGQPPPWATQPSPPPAGMTGPSKFTPQVILLVAVGAVCLAIFIVGIVLFVTTKF
jgi:hypothetical protein